MDLIAQYWGLGLTLIALAAAFLLLRKGQGNQDAANAEWAAARGWTLTPVDRKGLRVTGMSVGGNPFVAEYRRGSSSSSIDKPEMTWASPAHRSTGGTALLGWKLENQGGSMPEGHAIKGRMGALFLRAQFGPAANLAEGLHVVKPSDPSIARRYNVYASDPAMVEGLPALKLIEAVEADPSFQPGVAVRQEGLMLWCSRRGLRLKDVDSLTAIGDKVAAALAGSRLPPHRQEVPEEP